MSVTSYSTSFRQATMARAVAYQPKIIFLSNFKTKSVGLAASSSYLVGWVQREKRRQKKQHKSAFLLAAVFRAAPKPTEHLKEAAIDSVCGLARIRIGHFRVLSCLCFKTSLSAKLRLALKQRQKGTRIWPIHHD